MVYTMMRSESMMGRRCEDCGNQAKKECMYMRCRTCCKGKGFQCQTHIKSTWVPAYRRRQRQQPQPQTQTQSQSQLQQQHPLEHPVHHYSTNPKRLREGLGLITPSHFPAELNSTAVFRCVKVSSSVVDDDKDEYAYQTTVSIGGHNFKGILYDQGQEQQNVSTVHHHDDHHHHHHHHHRRHQQHHHQQQQHQEFLLPSSSSCPLIATTSPFTAFMSGTEFSPHHQKP